MIRKKSLTLVPHEASLLLVVVLGKVPALLMYKVYLLYLLLLEKMPYRNINPFIM